MLVDQPQVRLRHDRTGAMGQQEIDYYDMWASFQGLIRPVPPAFAPVSYTVDTTIAADHTLDGTATIELRAERGGERGIALELSRFLMVQIRRRTPMATRSIFSRTTRSDESELAERGNDLVFVFLPEHAQAGQTYRMRI